MTQKQLEERMEANEKEMLEMREMMMNVFKELEKLSDEIKENTLSRERLVLQEAESSRLKLRNKEGDEVDLFVARKEGNSDKSEYKRLEMSVFDGDNLESWMYREELFFEIHELFDVEKLKVAVISFAMEVVVWYSWTHNRNSFVSWEDLKERLFEHYCSTQEGNLGARLMRLREEGTYEDYPKKFVTYVGSCRI